MLRQLRAACIQSLSQYNFDEIQQKTAITAGHGGGASIKIYKRLTLWGYLSVSLLRKLCNLESVDEAFCTFREVVKEIL